MGIVLEVCIGGDSTSAIGSAKVEDAVVEIGKWPTSDLWVDGRDVNGGCLTEVEAECILSEPTSSQYVARVDVCVCGMCASAETSTRAGRCARD